MNINKNYYFNFPSFSSIFSDNNFFYFLRISREISAALEISFAKQDSCIERKAEDRYDFRLRSKSPIEI